MTFLVLLALVALSLVTNFVAVVSFQTSGTIIGSYPVEQLQWGYFGQLGLGSVILGGVFGWAMWRFTPEERRRALSGWIRKLRSSRPAQRRPSVPRAGSTATIEMRRHTGVPTAQPQLLRSDPQLEAWVVLLEQRLLEAEQRESARAAAAERRNSRRDYVLLGLGGVIGIIGPVVFAPLLRIISW